MLGVGRKPPSVLGSILLCALPASGLDNQSRCLGLLRGQMPVSPNPAETSVPKHIIALSAGCVVSATLQGLSPLPLARIPGPERGRTFLSKALLESALPQKGST